MKIPQEKIEEIRSAVDIVDVVGQHVQLKKRGKNYTGLCPFHSEKTPSFSVSPEKSMYYCFGCHEGGNAISFLMAFEKITFVEAVKSLALRAGIPLEFEQDSQESAERAKINEDLYSVCQTVANHFRLNLTDTNEGKFALEYFTKVRGFSADTVTEFGLGYSLNAWDGLVNFAKTEGIPYPLLEQAGLIKKRDDGSYHDFFHGRAMFPLYSTTGRVIGFGARKIYEDDPMGKYINSPETPIYSKSRSLYGLFQSKDAIREKDSVLLVEGYADLISLFQAGFKNVAASSGTALTAEQVQVLGRYTKKFVLLYDADAAGSKAAVRGADIILEQGMDAQVIELPAGYDPDKFIREKGAKEFQKAIDGSISFIDFVTRSFEKEGKLDTPEGQAEAVRTIVQSIAKIDDELKRGFYLKHLSEKYKIYESLLYRELEKTLTGSRRRFSGRQAEDAGSTNATKAGQSAADSRTIPEIPAPERDLLHAMFDGGAEIVRLVQEHVPLELLTNVQSRIIVEHLFAHLEESQQIDPAILIDELDDTLLKQRVSEIVFSKYHLSKNWDARGVIVEEANPFTIARDAINALRKRALEKIIEENQSRIKEGSRRGEDITRYLERHKTLNEEMKELVKGAGNEASAEQSATG